MLYEYLEVNGDRKISKDLRLSWLIFKAIDTQHQCLEYPLHGNTPRVSPDIRGPIEFHSLIFPQHYLAWLASVLGKDAGFPAFPLPGADVNLSPH